jgi:hypothetical protein
MAYLIRQAKQKVLADGVRAFHEDRKQKTVPFLPEPNYFVKRSVGQSWARYDQWAGVGIS